MFGKYESALLGREKSKYKVSQVPADQSSELGRARDDSGVSTAVVNSLFHVGVVL